MPLIIVFLIITSDSGIFVPDFHFFLLFFLSLMVLSGFSFFFWLLVVCTVLRSVFLPQPAFSPSHPLCIKSSKPCFALSVFPSQSAPACSSFALTCSLLPRLLSTFSTRSQSAPLDICSRSLCFLILCFICSGRCFWFEP